MRTSHLGLDHGVDGISVDDVLIDIPRREMDTGGIAYIDSSGIGGVRPLHEISKPVEAISSNYQQLTKRIRIFINPKLAETISKERRQTDRTVIREMILNATTEVGRSSQVR